MLHNSKVEEKRRREQKLNVVGCHYWGGYFRDEKTGWIDRIYPYHRFNRKKWARRFVNTQIRRKEELPTRGRGWRKVNNVMGMLY